MAGVAERPLWRCPRCGQTFVAPNMPHSCETVELDAHFAASRSHVRELFDALLAAVTEHGPVTVNATRSRITFQTRMRFGGVDRPRRDHLVANLVLTRPVRSARIERVDFIPPSYYVHRFRLRTPEDLDGDIRALLGEAYGVGQQRHLSDPAWPRERRPPDRVNLPGEKARSSPP
jgi:hypothetical protein